jgi:hypothetical protein
VFFFTLGFGQQPRLYVLRSISEIGEMQALGLNSNERAPRSSHHRGLQLGGGGGGLGQQATSNDNATSPRTGPREGGPQKCTDHNLASERQQAHTRKRVPTAVPPHLQDGIN